MHLPETLVVQLGRFNNVQTKNGVRLVKNSAPVNVPVELDIASFVSPLQTTQDRTMYDLSAVSLHGGAGGIGPGKYGHGHYMAYTRNVRVPGSPWFFCDDANVVPRPFQQLDMKQAYVLFYVRRGARASPAPLAEEEL